MRNISKKSPQPQNNILTNMLSLTAYMLMNEIHEGVSSCSLLFWGTDSKLTEFTYVDVKYSTTEINGKIVSSILLIYKV